MKHFLILMTSVFLSLGLTGQRSIPYPVLKSFETIEPNVSNPFWEYREGAYVAMFSHMDGLKKMFFSEEGEWLETRTRIDRLTLPMAVTQFINEHYGGADITYVGKIELPDEELYRVESELEASVVIKLLNEHGDLLEEQRFEASIMPQ